jgi:hypothetical protein
MTVSSDIVLANAARLLGDEGNIHWPAYVMLAWLNEAQHTIAVEAPTSSTTVADVTCVAGARQSLPDGGLSLLGVDNVRFVDKGSIDRENTTWQSTVTANNTTAMVAANPANPREFFTYPPREGTPGTLADVEYSVLPAAVTLGDDITLPDQYAEAITDWIIYRGLSEDTDLAEPGRAEHFLKSFSARVGGQ